ncbi:MAG: hypothetical protein D3923_07990 [Candidatus Electrothrix sp. AR3]|nr:hypothetical protein [Candidatus Electrothrix sp. AR3]
MHGYSSLKSFFGTGLAAVVFKHTIEKCTERTLYIVFFENLRIVATPYRYFIFTTTNSNHTDLKSKQKKSFLINLLGRINGHHAKKNDESKGKHGRD